MTQQPLTIPPIEDIQARFSLFDYIDGERIEPTVELDGHVHNPSTGDVIARQMATTSENVEKAIATAQRLHDEGTWRNTSPEERADLLDKAGDHLMALVPQIAAVESYHTGMTIGLTNFVNAIVWLAFKAAAGVLRTGHTVAQVPGPHGDVEMIRKPLGPAAAIVPWNSPAALAAHKVANALAAGAPVILKPSEWAPYSCLMLVDGLEQAGLPKGLFQIVNGGGVVGNQLVSDPRIRAVSFTGGLNGGRAVAAACAAEFKSMQLELGGNNAAMVVLEDADVDKVAQGIVDGMTTLNGQWCRALGRLLVHESIVDDVLAAALEKLGSVNLGDAMSPETQMGPLANGAHFKRVYLAVEELQARGAIAHTATSAPEGDGYFLPPTLITGAAPEETLEEIFGPVAAIHTFSTEAEAVALANQTPYGLGGYVYSEDEERAMQVGRQMNTGGVKINGVSLLELNVDAPRPAWGLSGFGEEGTLETFNVFCGTSVVGVANR
jgi:phenylacetaldehyde dehydrogenase